jgi:hypothetical protein
VFYKTIIAVPATVALGCLPVSTSALAAGHPGDGHSGRQVVSGHATDGHARSGYARGSHRARYGGGNETAPASVYQCFATPRSDAQRENTYIDVSNIAQQCVVSKINIVLQTTDQIGTQ